MAVVGFVVKSAYPSEVFSNCPEDMAGYSHDHNSVEEIPFQISHNLPQQPILLKQQMSADYLCALIARDPRCNSSSSATGSLRSVVLR